ncbi:SpaH/EbpB family LPXTG-anchored major pilin [Mediterraneibacter faecis]|uniref:SpaH/EbpB family LPXTG-anchored major pilin n=1 Tax=Mediterraneibacter faecis TaxID=592978 RepID=UPI001D022BD1|nr:SpaH/EbpB family LPXTG-anchored major pilin [Mediterraneibacter faecis]MCB5429419.1 SpaH/EbpB family LPXTG-anchored major pilin [Mediterraneibacter faecis]
MESFSDKTAENPGNYAYKATTKWKGFVESTTGKKYLNTDDDSGYVTWVKNADPAAFAKAALAYAKEQTSSIAEDFKVAPEATAGNTTSTVTFDKLSLGYYLVDSSVGALCSLDTTAKEVEIEEKNGVPSVEKKVQEDSTSKWESSNTADIGQTINFQTTITAQAGAQNYVLHDKMEKGLTFNNDINVKKNGTDVDTSNYKLITNTTDDCTFEIVFTQEFCDALNAKDTIIVTYSATLNENAKIGETGNTNEAKLEYGDKNTISSKTITKTYKIPVFKYTRKDDGTNKGLSGAIFTLSKNSKGENPIKLVKITETGNTYRVAKETETAGITKITEVTTPDDGRFTIQGLDADTYYLTETKQPDGYNKLSAPVKIVIKEDGTITIGDATDTVDEVGVENKSGSLLPHTGGMGTTLFYIFGAILVVGSGVVLITKKRMK